MAECFAKEYMTEGQKQKLEVQKNSFTDSWHVPKFNNDYQLSR